jgi:hypothetical protein
MSPEQQLVGKWLGKVETSKFVKAATGHASGLMDMFQPQLDLKPDKTFAMSLGPAPVEGTWKLEGETVILTPKTMMGMATADVRAKAEKEFEKAKNDAPFPIPFSPSALPGISEMKATLDEKHEKLTLDPGAGTVVAGFGRIVFKKA